MKNKVAMQTLRQKKKSRRQSVKNRMNSLIEEAQKRQSLIQVDEVKYTSSEKSVGNIGVHVIGNNDNVVVNNAVTVMDKSVSGASSSNVRARRVRDGCDKDIASGRKRKLSPFTKKNF